MADGNWHRCDRWAGFLKHCPRSGHTSEGREDRDPPDPETPDEEPEPRIPPILPPTIVAFFFPPDDDDEEEEVAPEVEVEAPPESAEEPPFIPEFPPYPDEGDFVEPGEDSWVVEVLDFVETIVSRLVEDAVVEYTSDPIHEPETYIEPDYPAPPVQPEEREYAFYDPKEWGTASEQVDSVMETAVEILLFSIDVLANEEYTVVPSLFPATNQSDDLVREEFDAPRPRPEAVGSGATTWQQAFFYELDMYALHTIESLRWY